MAFGLPSAEQMRDYLISQGVDPVVATERANVAARQNAAQAARTSALSLAAGAAPARAAGAAAVEAAPVIARSAMGVGERIAAAPRSVWEYLTTPAGVIRNPTTGARIPGQHPAGTLSATGEKIGGQRFRQPDYFLPGQRVAQGTAGGLTLGAGTAGVGALMGQPAAAPLPAPPTDGSISGEGYGSRYDQAMADGSISGEQYGERANMLAARALGEAAGLPMRRPSAAPSLESRQAAAQTMADRAPAPMRRPDEGFFSNLFTNRPATTKQLFEQSQADPSDSGAWMRAERQYARTHKDDPNFDVTRLNEQGMKRGGAANAKPDSLHKALEIIHHLLTRNH